jgi:DNA-binding transcriptional LysR family regulator
MDVRTMRHFLVLVEERHFGRAAARLHLAQPALSQQIKQLEATLGVRLFVRTTRRVTVTQAGERFADHARNVVAAMDHAADDMAAFAAGTAGAVAVGFVGTATYDVFPRLAHRVAAELPGIDLRLTGEMLSPRLLDDLMAGTYDLALVRPALDGTPDGSVHVETLRTEQLLAVLPETHPLAGSATVDLRDLRDETFVTHPAGARSYMHDRVLAACAHAGFRPATREIRETATMAVLVAAGLGVALAPEPVRSLGLAGVAYRPLRHVESVDLLLARRVPPSSPAVDAVADLVRQVASESADGTSR